MCSRLEHLSADLTQIQQQTSKPRNPADRMPVRSGEPENPLESERVPLWLSERPIKTTCSHQTISSFSDWPVAAVRARISKWTWGISPVKNRQWRIFTASRSSRSPEVFFSSKFLFEVLEPEHNWSAHENTTRVNDRSLFAWLVSRFHTPKTWRLIWCSFG